MTAAESAAPAAFSLAMRRSAVLSGSRLVCVDGPAGSGKTTFAAELSDSAGSAGCTVAVVHLDDLYEGWSGLEAEYADRLESRVLRQILVPLAAGEPARWQRYDWSAGQFDGWFDLHPPDLLVLEGCGSGARPYAAYITVLVWLEADRDTRIARGLERDGPDVLPYWMAWLETEAAYFARHDTRQRADLIVQTG